MGRTSDARVKILGAAQSLIELRGYSALGVAEICQAAGVPKGSFYYFFESKEALALAVLDEQWRVQRADWERVLGGDDTDPAGAAAAPAVRGDRGGAAGLPAELWHRAGLHVRQPTSWSSAPRPRCRSANGFEIFEAQVTMVANVVAEAQGTRRGSGG